MTEFRLDWIQRQWVVSVTIIGKTLKDTSRVFRYKNEAIFRLGLISTMSQPFRADSG